jgi:excisionase family DNA binding protein
MEKLYTAAEAAAILRIHLETLYRWCKQGRISFVRNGRKVIFREAAIREYLDNLEIPAFR